MSARFDTRSMALHSVCKMMPFGVEKDKQTGMHFYGWLCLATTFCFCKPFLHPVIPSIGPIVYAPCS
eukprot:1161595-Pelagomonas_calceolata.AAC.4